MQMHLQKVKSKELWKKTFFSWHLVSHCRSHLTTLSKMLQHNTTFSISTIIVAQIG
jgi:hypothetical protein